MQQFVNQNGAGFQRISPKFTIEQRQFFGISIFFHLIDNSFFGRQVFLGIIDQLPVKILTFATAAVRQQKINHRSRTAGIALHKLFYQFKSDTGNMAFGEVSGLHGINAGRLGLDVPGQSLLRYNAVCQPFQNLHPVDHSHVFRSFFFTPGGFGDGYVFDGGNIRHNFTGITV